jgi:hypothetical protein
MSARESDNGLHFELGFLISLNHLKLHRPTLDCETDSPAFSSIPKTHFHRNISERFPYSHLIYEFEILKLKEESQ